MRPEYSVRMQCRCGYTINLEEEMLSPQQESNPRPLADEVVLKPQSNIHRPNVTSQLNQEES